ncbi:unnamed protein product [Rangifer tarandus platyrhynchus]|uniref:Uncharacterized protein n=2 Tax=Rangifer tarandus platyrhynchus TaxID=3082113 RepID=A0ABN8XS13_RANTA|nr:unnamed protein product [Rangifer tarandus platyrhynchus]CAI9690863.1 unnamed protein product [Rangifer tarandus platyrhynchus]
MRRGLHSSILGPGSTLPTAVHFLSETHRGEKERERSERQPSGGRPAGRAAEGAAGCITTVGGPQHSTRRETRHPGRQRGGRPAARPPPAGRLARGALAALPVPGGADVAPAATNLTRKGCGGSVKWCQAPDAPEQCKLVSRTIWELEAIVHTPSIRGCAPERGGEESWFVQRNMFSFPG